MDQYCVVLCGLQAGASDETSAWQPVATALKLDHAEFERRVVAALPRIVRRELDQATAERIARVLQAMHVDARVLPDDPQLVYIERAGASCGPLPQSSLDDFIQPGESFRLRGSTTWQPWPEAVDQEPAASADADAIDDPSSSPAFSAEPIDAMATPDTSHDAGDAALDEPSIDADEPPEPAQNPPTSAASDDVSDATWDAVPSATDDEPRGAMPPPLGAAPATQGEPTPAPPEDVEVTEATTNTPEDVEVIEPATDTAASAHDEDLVNPAEETTAATSPDAASAATPAVVETRPPARSGRGRLVVLLVLVALAIWAYRHWMADTRTDGSPAVPAVVQPANTAAGESATPARVVPADNATSATAAAVTPATSSAAPAGTAAVPAAATSTPAPAASAPAAATASSTPAPAGTTAAPPVPAAIPAPATSTETPATIRPR